MSTIHQLRSLLVHWRMLAAQPDAADFPHRDLDGGRIEWLLSVLTPYARRQRIAAGQTLFVKGEAATSYYFVEVGKLLVYRHRHAEHLRPTVRFVTNDDVFVFDCDGVHVASCEAVVDSTVWRVDRRRFERQAMVDPRLKGVRNSVHAGDLEFILQSLGGQSCPPHHQAPRRALAAVPLAGAASSRDRRRGESTAAFVGDRVQLPVVASNDRNSVHRI